MLSEEASSPREQRLPDGTQVSRGIDTLAWLESNGYRPLFAVGANGQLLTGDGEGESAGVVFGNLDGGPEAVKHAFVALDATLYVAPESVNTPELVGGWLEGIIG